MKVVIILNARAGHAGRRLSHEAVALRARAVLARHGVEPLVLPTEGPGHARDLAQRAVADGADVVCAWGGDGTVNEVASGLVSGRGLLAIVPAGSGNGFARDLGVPLDKDEALELAVAGATRVVDVGDVNGRLFLGTMGLGLDGHIARAFARDPSGARGARAYVAAGLREGLRYRAQHCRVEVDGTIVTDARVKMVEVANIRQWGNNARVAPQAVPDDGLLDVVTVSDRATLALAVQVWRLWTGSIGRIRGVRMHTGREITIAANEPMPLHIDGEAAGYADRLAISIRPAALAVRVPG